MGRRIAIGDIHGCLQTLRELLEEKVLPGADDTLIFLGDYIDRGPDSKGVVDYLMHLENAGPECIFLRGNHEQTLIDALDAEKNLKKGFFSRPKNAVYQSWFEQFGGKQTMESYGISQLSDLPEAHERWYRSLLLYYRTDDCYFVHAGFNFSEPDILSDTHAMLWIREFDYDAGKTGGRKVVHGHVPVQLDFLKECLSLPKLGFVPLDTGCVYKQRPGMGYLSALDLSGGILYSLKNREREF